MTDFFNKILEYNNILIGIHVHPDGDCIGAALSMARILNKQYGKKVTLFSVDPIPASCKFLKNTRQFINKEKQDKYDLLLLLDVNSVDRTKIPHTMIPKNIFLIDHHEIGNIKYDNEIIETDSAATCQIIYKLFKENNIKIDKTTAEYLLCGIICDTGNFVHSNTTSEVFKIAGLLTELGAKPYIINKKYFNERPISTLELTGYVLNNLRTFNKNKIIMGIIDYNYIKTHKNIPLDSDPINEQLQSVKGHKLSLFLRELEPNVIRVSLRSPNTIDCNKIAKVFDGGGHLNAAGCTIRMPLENAINTLVSISMKEFK